MLKLLKEDEKIKSWNLVADKMRSLLFSTKSAKQCRERYINIVQFLTPQQ